MSSTRKIFLFVGLPLLVVFAVFGFYAVRGSKADQSATSKTTNPDMKSGGESGKDSNDEVSIMSGWQFNGQTWEAIETPPPCTEPLKLDNAPTDVTKATAILYPGQSRGGNYKSHGGFRFAETTNNISVKTPLAAKLVRASRYIEQGEVQYFFVFISECGILYRFDHLQTLTPKFQAIAETLPAAKVDDSSTTQVSPPVMVKAGEEVATAVGFTKTKNVSFDFGVNDLRNNNGVTPNPAWAAAFNQDKEFAPYGVCWFDLLPNADAAAVKNLPAGDGQAGKTSDYCK